MRIHPAAAARCPYTDSPENERQTRPPADVARLSTNRKTSGAQPQEREKKGKKTQKMRVDTLTLLFVLQSS